MASSPFKFLIFLSLDLYDLLLELHDLTIKTNVIIFLSSESYHILTSESHNLTLRDCLNFVA